MNGGVHLVTKIGAILRAVSIAPSGLTIAELSSALDMPRTTVQRLVEALVGQSFLMPAQTGKTYCLGFLLQDLASRGNWRLGEIGASLLKQLSESVGETVALATLSHASLIYTDMFHGNASIQAFVPIGQPLDMHSLASGKAIMAQMDEHSLQRLKLSMTLTSTTPRTIKSWNSLEKELNEVRALGYATDHQENALGVSAVAICVSFSPQTLFAVSIAGPSKRIEPREVHLARALRASCDALTRLLGYTD